MTAGTPGPGLLRAFPLVLLVLAGSQVRRAKAATSFLRPAVAGTDPGCSPSHHSSAAAALSMAALQPGAACVVALKQPAPAPEEASPQPSAASPQVSALSAPTAGSGTVGDASSGLASPGVVSGGDGFGNQPTVVRQGPVPPGGFSTETEWPQLLGTNALAAKDKLKAETGLKVYLVPKGSVVTDDYRENRIRIWFDPDTMLVTTPYPAVG